MPTLAKLTKMRAGRALSPYLVSLALRAKGIKAICTLAPNQDSIDIVFEDQSKVTITSDDVPVGAIVDEARKLIEQKIPTLPTATLEIGGKNHAD